MTFDLEIGGVPKQLLAGSLNIRKVANGRSTGSFRLDSQDRSYRAPLDAVVEMVVDGTTILGGLVDRPSEGGMFGGLMPGIRTTVNVVDFTAYTEWRHVNETFPAQTLKQRLQAIVTNYLADYGVTLHGSQVDGPTLPSVVYADVQVDAVLNETVKLTADAGQPFVWKLSDTKVLRGFQPSTQPAPFDLVGDVLPEVRGDVQVEPSNDGRANKVIVKIPRTEAPANYTESWTYGTDTYPFQLKYVPTSHHGHLTLSTGGGETMQLDGTLDSDGNPVQWWYDPVTNTLSRNGGLPTGGTVYTMMFAGYLAGRWEATDATWTSDPTSRKQKVIVLESIPDGITGQAFADAELAKSLTGPIYVRYKTWEDGIEPGQQQTINIPSRNVNADGVVTEVVIRDQFDHLEYSVTVIVDDAQTNLDRTWGDVYKAWLGDKTGGSAPEDTGDPVSLGPAPPNKSNQFNRSGVFGGSIHWTFDYETRCLVGGLDSSVTASDPESCQAWGYDTHIADAQVSLVEFVASTIKASPDGDTVTTDPIDTTGADFIAMAVSQYDVANPMSDSYGNTWGPVGAYNVGFGGTVEWFICFNPTVGPGHTFSCAPITPDHKPTLAVSAWSGVDNVTQVSSGGSGTPGTSVPSYPITPPVTGSLLLTALGTEATGGSVSVNSPFTILAQQAHGSDNMGLAHAWALATSEDPIAGEWSWPSSSILGTAIMALTPMLAPDSVRGSAVFGETTTVAATRAVALGLDGETNVFTEPGKFKVYGRGEFTEDLKVITPVDDMDAVTKEYCDGNAGIGIEEIVSRLLFTDDGALVLDDDGVPLYTDG